MNWVIVVCSAITPEPREFNSDRCHRPWVNVSTNESERKRPANHKESHFTTQRARGTFRTLTVVQCDQTSFLTTSMMLLSKEARRPLQRPVQLPLTNEVQHGNRIDCSRSAVFAWWRRLGILSLARLAQPQNERVNMLLDGIHAIHEGRSTSDASARALFQVSCTKSAHQKCDLFRLEKTGYLCIETRSWTKFDNSTA